MHLPMIYKGNPLLIMLSFHILLFFIGEPILTPELQSGANVTPTEQCPRCCNFYLVHNYKYTE